MVARSRATVSLTEDPIAKYNAMRAAVNCHASVSVVPTALAEILQAEPVPCRPSEPPLQLETPDNQAMEPECNEQVQNSTLINHTQDAAPADVYDMSDFLDMNANENTPQAPPFAEVVKQLIKGANKHKSFTALFKLQAVKAYLELYK